MCVSERGRENVCVLVSVQMLVRDRMCVLVSVHMLVREAEKMCVCM